MVTVVILCMWEIPHLELKKHKTLKSFLLDNAEAVKEKKKSMQVFILKKLLLKEVLFCFCDWNKKKTAWCVEWVNNMRVLSWVFGWSDIRGWCRTELGSQAARQWSPPTGAGDTGDSGSVPGSGRSPAGGNGSLLQCSFREDSTDREAWLSAVHGVTKRWPWTQLRELSTHTYTLDRTVLRTQFLLGFLGVFFGSWLWSLLPLHQLSFSFCKW